MEVGKGLRVGGWTWACRKASIVEEEEEAEEDRSIHQRVEERQEHPIAIGGKGSPREDQGTRG